MRERLQHGPLALPVARSLRSSSDTEFVPRGRGEALADATRAVMESRFEHDFSSVRIHRDVEGAALADRTDSLALTVGSHIAFAAGRWDPHTRGGMALLGHELAHVIQQQRGGSVPLPLPGGPLEREAHRAGEAAASGSVVHVGGGSAIGLARQPRSLTRSFDYHRLSDTQLLTEMQLMEAWLRAHPEPTAEAQQLAEALRRASQEALARGTPESPNTPVALGFLMPTPLESVAPAAVAEGRAAVAEGTALAEAGAAVAERTAVAEGGTTLVEGGGIGLGATAVGALAFLGVLLWPSEIAPEPPMPARQPRADAAPITETTTTTDAPPDTQTRSRSCATDYPGVPLCSALPPPYTYRSVQSALSDLKARLGVSSLSLHSQGALATGGPCPGIGTHANVRAGGRRVASITCCPCCNDTPAGPVTMTRCRIVW